MFFLQPEDDFGDGLDDDDELEYDALNDETFGAAVSTDWEGIHENLVKLESEKKQTNEKPHRAPVENANSSRNKYGADLDMNLSRVSLDDCFLENLDDPELPLKLDSSVWSSPVDHRKRDDPYNALSKPDMSKAPKAPVLNSHSPLPKMFTVEDIERNIRKAQTTPRDALGALGMPLHYAPEPPKPPNLPPPPNQLNCRSHHAATGNSSVPTVAGTQRSALQRSDGKATAATLSTTPIGLSANAPDDFHGRPADAASHPTRRHAPNALQQHAWNGGCARTSRFRNFNRNSTVGMFFLQPEDDFGDGLDDDDELEYDALNDETFGAAVSTDWEGIHENLVKLESEKKQTNEKPHRAPVENANSSRNKYGADLDVNLSRVSLDDCFLENLDDPELPLKLDSSVWSSPVDHRKRDDPYNALSKPDMSKAPKAPVLNSHSPLPKMFTVEDIERNIRKAQTTPRDALGALGMPLHYAPEPPKPPNLPPPPNHLNCRHIMPPPGILPSPLSQAHNVPLYNVPMAKQQPPPFRPPPSDFPLMHLMTSMGGPPMPRPIPPAGMPQMPYSNMPMHSNFGGVRPPMPGQPGRINPLMNGPPFPTPPPPTSQMQSNPVSVNQYNKRLVQEIQQNHPMLYFNRMNNFDAGNNSYHQNQMNGSKNSNQNHQQQHRFKQQQQHKSDGNLNLEEYDEYANLMSQRNKQWLIGIQLLQLNTETPYIDDYYYTVFKERRMRRERESKAHRDNQMNHPLTQPKGHQQLVLMSMGKNGTNQRNHDRDKKNQDANKGDKEMTPRTYTPLQFENSLGKLQCGSVTAPRKIIDMDIMGPETGYQLNPSIELSTQKKSRQMLLHIESLYKIVLKIEDLKNPIAVSTALVVKAKKERERKQALEQLESEDPADGEGKSRQAVLDAIDEKYPEPEKLDDLLPQLVAGLSVDKVMGMMNVRKGKTLIKRALPHLVDEEHKWQVWQAIFAVLPIITKKDRDDTDGSLGGLFTEFKNHLIVAKLGDFITFGMLSIIAMMLRVETIFQLDENEPPLTASNDGTAWGQFVATLAACAAKQPLTEAEQSLDKEILQILLNHLRRYPEIETQPLTTALSQVEFK
uniref:Uncharacterized protein n=1 Tax=Lutzomyia longipalpis TaxID=7200 RepID=A0A1B0C9X8_LUTLO